MAGEEKRSVSEMATLAGTATAAALCASCLPAVPAFPLLPLSTPGAKLLLLLLGTTSPKHPYPGSKWQPAYSACRGGVSQLRTNKSTACMITRHGDLPAMPLGKSFIKVKEQSHPAKANAHLHLRPHVRWAGKGFVDQQAHKGEQADHCIEREQPHRAHKLCSQQSDSS